MEHLPLFRAYISRGMKHRCTSATLRYLRSEVMEMCHKENLYQIDLLNGSKERALQHLLRCEGKRKEATEHEKQHRQVLKSRAA